MKHGWWTGMQKAGGGHNVYNMKTITLCGIEVEVNDINAWDTTCPTCKLLSAMEIWNK